MRRGRTRRGRRSRHRDTTTVLKRRRILTPEEILEADSDTLSEMETNLNDFDYDGAPEVGEELAKRYEAVAGRFVETARRVMDYGDTMLPEFEKLAELCETVEERMALAGRMMRSAVSAYQTAQQHYQQAADAYENNGSGEMFEAVKSRAVVLIDFNEGLEDGDVQYLDSLEAMAANSRVFLTQPRERMCDADVPEPRRNDTSTKLEAVRSEDDFLSERQCGVPESRKVLPREQTYCTYGEGLDDTAAVEPIPEGDPDDVTSLDEAVDVP